MYNLKEVHLQAADRVLCYLKGTPGKDIMFKKDGRLVFEAYIDINYVGSMVNKRSTAGYCTFFEDNLITWRSEKENVVVTSSAN